MEDIAIWISPLLLLPGAGLLIMSTSARYAQIHEELHELLSMDDAVPAGSRVYFLRRATLFRNALVSLYTAAGLLALAGLLGGLTSAWEDLSVWMIFLLTCLGILGLIVGIGFLVRESITSLEVIRHHIDRIAERDES
jgi:hypothetical protein